MILWLNFAFLLESHRNDLKKIFRFFHLTNFELIDLFAEIVANTSDWRLFLNFFFQRFFSFESFVFVEISMILWSKFFVFFCIAKVILTKTHCVVLNVDFHVNDLVESNYFKINAFKNFQECVSSTYENLIIFDNCFSRNTVCVLAWNQEIKITETFCACIAIHFVSTFTFAHSSKKRESISCFFVCTFWEETSLRVSETKNKCIQQFVSTLFCVCTLFFAKLVACRVSQSYENL